MSPASPTAIRAMPPGAIHQHYSVLQHLCSVPLSLATNYWDWFLQFLKRAASFHCDGKRDRWWFCCRGLTKCEFHSLWCSSSLCKILTLLWHLVWDEAGTASPQFKTSCSAVAGGTLSTSCGSKQHDGNLWITWRPASRLQRYCQVCMLLRPQGAWEACRTAANDLGTCWHVDHQVFRTIGGSVSVAMCNDGIGLCRTPRKTLPAFNWLIRHFALQTCLVQIAVGRCWKRLEVLFCLISQLLSHIIFEVQSYWPTLCTCWTQCPLDIGRT